MKLLPFFEERFDDNGKSQANYRHIRSVASKFITKLLKYGDEAFELCSKRADQTQRHADHVLLALARHNAAYLDSVNALLVTGCVVTLQPFEVTFSGSGGNVPVAA